MQNETQLKILCVLSSLIGFHRYVLHFFRGLTVFVVSGPLIWRDSPAVVATTFLLSTWHNTDSHWQPATFLGNHQNRFQSLLCSVIFCFCWRSMCSEMLKRRDQRQRDLFAKCLTGCSFWISCSLFPIVCVGALPSPARVCRSLCRCRSFGRPPTTESSVRGLTASASPSQQKILWLFGKSYRDNFDSSPYMDVSNFGQIQESECNALSTLFPTFVSNFFFFYTYFK